MAGRFSVEAVFKAIDKMTAPISRMQSRLDKFAKAAERGIKDLDKAADSWLGGLKKASIGAAAATAATGYALAAAAKPGMEFEQAMADLGASYLKRRDEIGDLEQAALKLGASTKFSATDVAIAMQEMSKAGYEPQDVLKGIEGMTYAAAAAGEELVPTAINVSAAMKAMGRDTALTTRTADVLSMASVRSAASIASLAESLSKVGPVAKQFNIPFEDTVAMVAMLQDAGIDASEAGSAVATMLSMMASPTDAVKAKMKKLGISFKDAAGNMKAPQDVLGQLVKISETAGGNMEQVAFFTDLLGMRGQKAALNLKDLFASGKYSKLLAELGDKANGTAEKMSDLRMATLGGDLDVFTENVKSLGIELYSVQSGGLRGVVQGMTQWLDANKDLITSNITAVLNAISNNFESIVAWARRIATIVAVFTTAALAVKAWAGAVWLLNAAIAANPITLIAIAIVAAIALILAFWPEISAFFSAIWDGIVDIASSIASTVGSIVSTAFAPIKDFFMAWFEFYVGIWTLIAGAALAIARPAFDLLLAWWRTVFDTFVAVLTPLTEVWTAVWNGIVAASNWTFDLLVEGFMMWVERIREVVSPIVEVFTAVWHAVADTFSSVLGPIWDSITWAIDQVRDIGRNTLGTNEGAGVVSPQERVATSISESRSTTEAEVTIRDQTGRAAVTKKPKGPGVSVGLNYSGVF